MSNDKNVSLRELLPAEMSRLPIYIYEVTDSTNLRAKEFSKSLKPTKTKGAKSGLKGLFVAYEQTNGRGRLGRSFYSPKSTGIYMSLVLSADRLREDMQMVTIGVAVAVCEAVKEVCDIELRIKWVNDLYKDGKKVCGILAEAVCDEDNGGIKDIVVGIGINCETEEFPDNIKDIATSLSCGGESAEKFSKKRLIAKITENVVAISERLSDETTIEAYRKMSLMYGKEVSYEYKGELRKGIVEKINNMGNLVVKAEDGTIDVLLSGDVSVKGVWD